MTRTPIAALSAAAACTAFVASADPFGRRSPAFGEPLPGLTAEQVAALLARFDRVADPEDETDPESGKSDVDRFADFMRLLAPLPQARFSAPALAGARVFDSIKCTACHQPFYLTGPSRIGALWFKPVALFSDLLLHDMGTLGDGIAQGAARMREMRTAPLWGLRARTAFLHDGRATSVGDAIAAHDGEGAVSRERYLRLGETERKQPLEFLNTI